MIEKKGGYEQKTYSRLWTNTLSAGSEQKKMWNPHWIVIFSKWEKSIACTALNVYWTYNNNVFLKNAHTNVSFKDFKRLQ